MKIVIVFIVIKILKYAVYFEVVCPFSKKKKSYFLTSFMITADQSRYVEADTSDVVWKERVP